MSFRNKMLSLFRTQTKEEKPLIGMNIETIAQHEAAHGIVWYLFRDNWIVNQLTIERNNLPDERMNAALHITTNFNVNEENNIDRANELFSIVLAGMIGQNMNLILQRPNLVNEISRVSHFNQILDTTGCGGDFEIAARFLPQLGIEFRIDEGAFTKYKIMDLVLLFQNHDRVQQLHSQLTQILLEKGTITGEELTNFFEGNNFQEYIEDNNLDINFYNRR